MGQMARKTAKPSLTVVGAAPAPAGLPPPKSLGPIGRRLWIDITASYAFDDPGSYQTLLEACHASDRAEACRLQINKDGEMLVIRDIVKEHPLLKHELANRAFVCRTLARLGLDLEPLRGGPGRPPGR